MAHTKQDIAFTVSVVGQFMHDLCTKHHSAVDRILRYLKVAPGKGLMFSKHGHLDVYGYANADWVGSISDKRSTSHCFTFVGGNLVPWRTKKQNVYAKLSAET